MLYSQVSLIFDLIINMNNQIGGQNMKYTYAFSDEENTVEIDKKWVDILNEFDKTEQSNDRSELRRKQFLMDMSMFVASIRLMKKKRKLSV